MPTVTSENKAQFDKEFMEKRSPKPTKTTDKPLATGGLKSYRYKGRYGHIMIGAKDHGDAMNEAKRSTGNQISQEDLEMYDDKLKKYVPVGKQLTAK
jgi:hypothetical protein